MTESFCQYELERDEEMSVSDDESVSLLRDLTVCQSGGRWTDTQSLVIPNWKPVFEQEVIRHITLLTKEKISNDLDETEAASYAAAGSAFATEDMTASTSGSQVTGKEMKEKMQRKLNQPKPRQRKESKRDMTERKCAASSSQSDASARAAMPKYLNVHRRNGVGETFLHGACKKGDLAHVKALIQAGVCVNALDNAGWTALHEASAKGDEAVVEELLKAGANVNARSYDGVTPLHDAVVAGHYQVVKLLLQSGSNPNDRGFDGVSAVDMAEEENIKELLMTFQASSATEESCKAPAESRQAGAPSPGPGCSSQLSCWSHSRSRGCGDTTNLQSGESGDGGGAREPAGVQMRERDAAFQHLSHSDAITAILGDVRRKQAELSAWPLTDLGDADRYHAALMQIQSVLTDVLTKQRLEKDGLAQKYRRVSESLHRVLKTQLVSLASRQRNLIEVLQRQMHLEQACMTTKVRFSTLPPEHEGSHQLDHRYTAVPTEEPSKYGETYSCHQFREQSGRAVTRAGALKRLPVQNKKAPTRPGLQNSTASSCQSTPQPGTTLHHISFKMIGKNALIQARAGDSSGYLSRLIQGGALAPGSVLQLVWKQKQHRALLLADGSITSKGKSHRALEDWLESILGNNIPVSSEYALEKVTFRDVPLSCYLLSMEAEEKASQARPENSVQRDGADSAREEPTPEPGSLNHLLKIKTVHLVGDDELAPNAVMDYYWDTFLKDDLSESEDWESEV